MGKPAIAASSLFWYFYDVFSSVFASVFPKCISQMYLQLYFRKSEIFLEGGVGKPAIAACSVSTGEARL